MTSIHFAQFWRLGSPRSRHQQIQHPGSQTAPSCYVLGGRDKEFSEVLYMGTNPIHEGSTLLI